MMIGSTSSRISTINLLQELDSQRETGLQSIIGKARNSMSDIHQTFHEYEHNISTQIKDFRENMETTLIALDMSEEQENTLLDSLDLFVMHVTETEDTKDLIEKSFNDILTELDQLN